jgi:hypothetical protein
MTNTAYDTNYASALDHMDFIVKSLAEKPGRAIGIAIEHGGETSVQALFDAVMDKGHRMVLVQALDAPSLPNWVREKLEVFLYGHSRQVAALFGKKTVH